jgi:phosphoenolpyruvate carboxykinase (GTP)
MANLDFLSISIGEYIRNYLSFGRKLRNPPPIFSANYFLKDDSGRYLNDTQDKMVWLKWMELRSHGDVGAVETPTGYAPTYEDLKGLFRQVLGREYSRAEYERQFTIRVPENLLKIERLRSLYQDDVGDAPQELFRELEDQTGRLEETVRGLGDYVAPWRLETIEPGCLPSSQVRDVEASAVRAEPGCCGDRRS